MCVHRAHGAMLESASDATPDEPLHVWERGPCGREVFDLLTRKRNRRPPFQPALAPRWSRAAAFLEIGTRSSLNLVLS